MARIAEGDGAAFARLMDRHVDRAFRLASRLLGSRADAEDAVQEAFLKAWTRAGAWRPTGPGAGGSGAGGSSTGPERGGGSFATWLWRVVVNQCLDVRRRPAAAPLDSVPEPPDEAPDAAMRIEAAEDERRVAGAVADLPERQRAALALVYGAGASNAEAAESLGISVGALEQLLVRARRTLRDQLADPVG